MFSKTLQTDAGALQTGLGIFGMHKNQKALDALSNPMYTPNRAIADYYSAAKSRYDAGPYNSNYYQQAEKNAGRGLATGISSLMDRHSAGNIAGLVQGNEDQLQKAGVQAEAMQSRNLGQLGQAAGAKAGDDRYAFDINQMMPFERKYGELSQRLQNSRALFNSGVNNLFGGLTGGGGQGLGGITSLPGASKGGGGLAGTGSYTPSYSNSQFND
jgi:hypothetical protein